MPILVLALIGVGGCSVPGLWKYVAENDEAAAGDGAFNAVSYVGGIWESQVLPTVQERAVDATVLLPAIAADSKAATTTYGVASASGGSPSFLIKGSGPVTAVDAESPNGVITVSVAGAQVKMVTGPVIIGTALRDAVGFIKFSDFINQIDFANVATQLNAKVKTDVSTTVTLDDSLVGKTLSFAGAFTLLSPTDITVVPTSLSVS